MRGHLTPREAGEHARKAGARRGAHPHLRRARPAVGARRGRRGFGGQVDLAREGAVLHVTICHAGPVDEPPGRRSGYAMARERDLFANFERMRPRDRRAVRRRLRAQPASSPRGFSPAVDVYYTGDPPRAIVRRRPRRCRDRGVALEIRGRQLVIAGERRAAGVRGPALPADRDRARPVPARGRAGRGRGGRRRARDLRGRHPARRDPARLEQRSTTRQVPIKPRRARMTIEMADCPGDQARNRAGEHLGSASSAGLPVLPLKDTVPFPEHADAARHRPGALGPARERRARRRADAGDGRVDDPRGSTCPGPTTSTTSAWRASWRGCSRCPTARCGSSSRAPSECGSRTSSATEPYLVAQDRGGARTWSSRRPSSRRQARNVQSTFARSSSRSRTCPRSSRSRSRTSRTRRARLHDRRRAPDHHRGEAGAARGARRRQAPAQALRAARPRAGADLDRLADPVAGPVRDGEGPARVLPAPAAQGDPGGARRDRRAAGRGRRAARADRGEPARGGRRPPSASSSGSSACRRSRPSTA